MNSNQKARDDAQNLEFNLWELVSDDFNRRHLAASALEKQRELSTEIGTGNHPFEPYFGAVRAVVDLWPNPKKREFIFKLTDMMARVRGEERTLRRADFDRENELWEEKTAALSAVPTENKKERHQIVQNALQATAALAASQNRKSSETRQTALSTQYIAAMFVFDALDEAFLSAPERLKEFLNNKDNRFRAAKVLERLGPRAAQFTEFLFAKLDASGENQFEFAPALAAIIRDNSGAISALQTRLFSPQNGVARGAATTLQFLGAGAREMAPQSESHLLQLLENPETVFAAIDALGKIGQSDETVERLLILSRSDDVWIKGHALSALGELKKSPEKVVPRLIEAFDDYDEPDSDLTYRSRHLRVCEALENFGPPAAPAVPALLKFLKNDEGLDGGVLRVLAAIGPAAGNEAWLLLEDLATEYELEPEDFEEPYDPLVLALLALRGPLNS